MMNNRTNKHHLIDLFFTRSLQSVAALCGISAMPTFQVWKNGEKVQELVGASKEKLKALVEAHK